MTAKSQPGSRPDLRLRLPCAGWKRADCCNSTTAIPNFLHWISCFITADRHLDYVSYVMPVMRGGHVIARLEAALFGLVVCLCLAFIGLAVVAPERIDRTLNDILTGIVRAVAGN